MSEKKQRGHTVDYVPDCDCWEKRYGFFNNEETAVYHRLTPESTPKKCYWKCWWRFCYNCGAPAKEEQ